MNHGSIAPVSWPRRLAPPVGLVLGLTFVLALASPALADEVTFSYAAGGAREVYLAGTFNSWSATANPMSDADGDGTFETTLDLAPGRYEYKFVADGAWHPDPTAAESAPDGYGGENSIIIVGLSGTEQIPAGEYDQMTQGGVTFSFRPPAGTGAVNLAGSFNGWSTSADRMTDDDGDGVFTITKTLAPGRYEYKFVADGAWHPDPSAPASAPDGYGGQNSVMEIGAGGAVVSKTLAATPQTGPGAAVGAPAGAAGATSTAKPVDIEFRYEPVIGGPREVYLAGSFNDWSTSADRMTDDDGDGAFTITKALAPGKYPYKFVVDGNWFTDENAAEFVDDGYGGQNSIVVVDAAGALTAERARASAAAAGLYRVTFRHLAGAGQHDVNLAGTFNDWSTTATPMTDPDGDGEYEVTLVLPGDRYQYKFVVDGNWITDRSADEFTDDGFGGQNSIVVVNERFPRVSLEPGDGKIFTEGIRHTPGITVQNLVSDRELLLRTLAYHDDVESVVLHWRTKGDAGWNELPMTRFSSDAAFDHYEITLTGPQPIGVIEYLFAYRDGETTLWLGPEGFWKNEPAAGWFTFDPALAERVAPPDWVRDGIIYQIFPDRFYNGDPDNDQSFKEWYYEGKNRLPRLAGGFDGEYYHLVKDWYDVAGLAKSPYRGDGKPDWFSFYGGDINGVAEKLDYLVDLGITIIYFNPVNEGKSNHKYDATDYMTVDPHFGGNEVFREFVDAAHARGIRIIIDTVFNHTGDTHWAFQDGLKKGPQAEYWNWYEWKKWPLPNPRPASFKAEDYYACWWGFGDLPDLNFDLSRPNAQENGTVEISDAQPNQAVVDHLLEVGRFWLEDMDIDGFRLDVPNEVPFWFWRLFATESKRIKPDAYIVCEIWGDASQWIAGGYADATMNYRYFRDPVLNWIAKGQGTAQSFDRALAPGRFAYPPQSQQAMMNLIDSHDTVRFLTQAGGDARRLRLAALFQMTYVGAPHIWYGDEIAMDGGGDPDCRRPMYWKWADDPERMTTREHYRKLTALRTDLRALRRGSFHTLVADGQVLAYVRQDTDHAVVVALNNGPRETVAEIPIAGVPNLTPDQTFADELDGGSVIASDGVLRVNLPAVTGKILTARWDAG